MSKFKVFFKALKAWQTRGHVSCSRVCRREDGELRCDPRQRGPRRGGAAGHPAGCGIPAALQERRHPGLAVLPSVGPQRAGRAFLHQPLHVQDHPVS